MLNFTGAVILSFQTSEVIHRIIIATMLFHMIKSDFLVCVACVVCEFVGNKKCNLYLYEKFIICKQDLCGLTHRNKYVLENFKN